MTSRVLSVGAPIVAAVAVVITLITCVAITKSDDIYVGGLAWPYFSDMGRDSPAYEVFCTGLSVASISLGLTWVINHRLHQCVFQHDFDHRFTSLIKWTDLVVRSGVLSVIGLPILAFFSTSSYPDVHQYAAYWFFVLAAVALFSNTLVTYKLTHTRAVVGSDLSSPDDQEHQAFVRMEKPSFERLVRTFQVQAAFATVFFFAFLLYLPIGLAIIEPFKRLTISQCLQKDLGTDYCTKTMKYSTTDTKLWNYEDDLTANQIRSASQLACILSLVGYLLSFTLHDLEE